MIKNCLHCENVFHKNKNESKRFFIEERKYCSIVCKNRAKPTKYWLGKKISGNRKTGWKHSEEINKKKSERQKGFRFSEETKRKMSATAMGKPATIAKETHWNWKGGITPENQKIRTSTEYKSWRKSVFNRDKYACVWCGAKSGNGKKVILHADHIKSFAFFPQLRLDINNGRTLCKECHVTTDNYAGRAYKTQPTQEEYVS